MRFNLSRRVKLIGGIIVGILLILSGTIFGLAKTGKIHLGIFADPIGMGEAYITVDSTNFGGGFAIYQNNILIRNSVNNSGYDTYNYGYHILGLPFGTYQYTIYSSAGSCWSLPKTFNFTSTNLRDTYPKFTCGTPPVTGTYSLEGFISGGGQYIAGAYIALDGNSSVHTTTATNGYYKLDNIPFGTYDQLNQQTFSYSASGYTPRYSLHLQGVPPNGLGFNISTITSGRVVPAVNVSLTRIDSTFQYKITGNIKGTGGNLAGAQVKLVDKSATPPTQLTNTTTVSGTYSGKNYLSSKFGSAGFDNAYLQISATGYSLLEVKLLDPGVILTRTASGSGTDVYELMTIKDLTLVMPQSTNFDLQGIVKDKNNNILSGVTITVLCPVADASPARTRCESKRANGVDPTTTSRSNSVRTHGQDQNFLISNIYNIAQPGVEFSHYRLVISKPGYYHDSNGDGRMNSGEDSVSLLVLPNKILPPQNSSENSYYAINLDTILFSERPINISGIVTKSISEGNVPLKDGELELKDLTAGTTLTQKSLASGSYSFAGLALTHKYRITCRYSGRTTQSREIVAISGQGARVDFAMNVNSDFQYGGYVKGHIYRTKDGINTPLNKASVALYRIENNKKILYRKVVSDDKGYFVVRLDPADLFIIEGNGQTVGDWKFRLQAGSFFPLLKNSYDFTLHWREGVIYEQDIYMAYNSDLTISKTVDVTVVKETRNFVTGQVINSAKAVGVPVHLTQTFGGESDLASTVLYTGNVATKANGIASFSPLDKLAYNIELQPPSGYLLDTAKSQMAVSVEGKTATIYVYAYNVPGLSVLNRNIDKYYFAQGGGNWSADRDIFNRSSITDTAGETPNRTIKEVGCCLTSIAMSMNRYMPGKGITPKVIGDYFRSHNYNANLGFKTQWQQAVDVISGGKLTIGIYGGNVPSWDEIKTDFIDRGIPVMVHSNNWDGHTGSMGHCVFIYGIDKGQISFFDPAPGSASKNRSQSTGSVSINTLIIVQPLADVTFSAIFAPFAKSLVQSALAANASVSNGYSLTLATSVANPSEYDVAAVYVEKFVGNNFIKKYKMNFTASNGKYQVVLPGYDNTASFKYRYNMIDGLGMAHPGTFNNVSISMAKPPVVKKVTNSIEKATATVTQKVKFFLNRFK